MTVLSTRGSLKSTSDSLHYVHPPTPTAHDKHIYIDSYKERNDAKHSLGALAQSLL